MPLAFVIGFLLFLSISAFFSFSETAILSSNKFRVRHLAAKGNKRAQRLAEWLDEPEKLLATILLGNTFANSGTATVGAALTARLVSAEYLDVGLAIQTLIATVLILLFCELGPKAIAARNPEPLALRLVIPVELCMRLLYPITRFGVRIVDALFRTRRNGSGAGSNTMSEAEIRSIISGQTHASARMLERVLEFSERPVKDVMVPRLEVTALDINTPLESILNLVESTRYSRFPVYQGVLDNIVGILHGKDLMPYVHTQRKFRLSQLLRKPVFISDTTKLNVSIRLLQTAQTHLGIVVDEHGGVEGIITVEDLIEQIVGEIQDEHDVEVDSVVSYSDGTAILDAGASIRDLNEKLSLLLPESTQYATLAGFLLSVGGRLPREGEEIRFGSHVFRIEQMVGRRIVRVRLRSEQKQPAADLPADATEKTSTQLNA